MKIGYARVSTEDQDLGRQLQALQAAGCEVIHQEKESGYSRDRPELARMVDGLSAGDVVIVQKLDRLGRSLHHLLDLVKGFKDKGVGFISLGDSFDTTTAQGMLMFQMMGAMAEFERNLIADRIRHALAYKKSQGVILGRPKKERGADLARVLELEGQGLTRAQVCTALGWGMTKYYEVMKWRQGTAPQVEKIPAESQEVA